MNFSDECLQSDTASPDLYSQSRSVRFDRLQRIPEELMLCHYTPPGDILSYIGSLESGNLKPSLLQALTTEDKDQTDPHEPIASGVAQPSQATSEISTMEDCLPHEENVLPELYHYIPSKEYPIFGTSRSRTTYTTGLGDANYKFCLENWLKTPTPSASSGEERTSTRREMSASIDSLSTNGDNKLPKVHQLPSDAEVSALADLDDACAIHSCPSQSRIQPYLPLEMAHTNGISGVDQRKPFPFDGQQARI